MGNLDDFVVNMSIHMGKGASGKKGQRQKNMSMMLGSGAGTAHAKAKMEEVRTRRKVPYVKSMRQRWKEGQRNAPCSDATTFCAPARFARCSTKLRKRRS